MLLIKSYRYDPSTRFQTEFIEKYMESIWERLRLRRHLEGIWMSWEASGKHLGGIWNSRRHQEFQEAIGLQEALFGEQHATTLHANILLAIGNFV